ncbi:MAG TPA: hypothetical protein VMI72_09010 [Roseiarcus sp.]|nr:hypothetical protein [Roseiarcus sp.]
MAEDAERTEAPRRRRIWEALADDIPYLAIIVLGLVGTSWTSIARSPTTTYWVVMTPVFAAICIYSGWRHIEPGARMGMVLTQILQWVAFLIAMDLVTVTDTRGVLNANGTGLMLLTLLALGVFVSGLHLRSWKLCVTGAFLAISVPVAAWVQRAALLLLLIGVAVIALFVLYWWFSDRLRGKEA